jgi:hypothetical protein
LGRGLFDTSLRTRVTAFSVGGTIAFSIKVPSNLW